jgi:protein TonB
MSHALPAPLYDLDTKRILATAATIAIHLIALMLLLAPMEWTPPAPTVGPTTTVVEYRKPVVIPPPPPPPPVQTHPIRPVTEAPVAPTPITEAPPVISDDSGPMALPYEPVDEIPQTFNPPPTGPIALAVLEGPAPVYPTRAISMGITGRVLLRIEVDANGRAISGVIERSSGSKLLDNAALRVVLAKWRFVPAQHAGQNIAATALVPIVFSLD